MKSSFVSQAILMESDNLRSYKSSEVSCIFLFQLLFSLAKRSKRHKYQNFCLIFRLGVARNKRLKEIIESNGDSIRERKLLAFSQCFEVKVKKCDIVDLFSQVQYHQTQYLTLWSLNLFILFDLLKLSLQP